VCKIVWSSPAHFVCHAELFLCGSIDHYIVSSLSDNPVCWNCCTARDHRVLVNGHILGYQCELLHSQISALAASLTDEPAGPQCNLHRRNHCGTPSDQPIWCSVGLKFPYYYCDTILTLSTRWFGNCELDLGVSFDSHHSP